MSKNIYRSIFQVQQLKKIAHSLYNERVNGERERERGGERVRKREIVCVCVS